MKFEFIDNNHSKYEFDFSNYTKTKSVFITCQLSASDSDNFLYSHITHSFGRTIKNKKVLWMGNDLIFMSGSARTYCQKIINNIAFI